MKKLIVTGDDFGMSPAVNAGILEAYSKGILRGTSLMVAGAAASDAARIAHEHPGLDVGLHLVVCQGHSALPSARLSGLVDASGRFPTNPTMSGMRYFFDRRVRAALRAECEAQIERHLQMVGSLNHIDGHLNFHVHPVIADITIDLAVQYRVPYIRLPRERVFTTLRLARNNAIRKLVEAVIFHLLSRRARRRMIRYGIGSSDELFGLHQSGSQSEEYVLGVISRLNDGVTEFYFHPAAGPRSGEDREVGILTSRRVHQVIDRNQVTLTNFAELARSRMEGHAGPTQAASTDIRK
jgi:hopanoid biosynthesis associated protein HpnK